MLENWFYIHGDAESCKGLCSPLCLPAGSSPAGSQAAPSIRLWSDYLSVNLHPKSLQVIRQYLHDGYGQGCAPEPRPGLSFAFKDE